MDDLLDEMRQCKSVQGCIDLALTDAYGADEQAVAWLTCIEEMFSRFKRVKVMGSDVVLVGFDLSLVAVVVIKALGNLRRYEQSQRQRAECCQANDDAHDACPSWRPSVF